MIFLKLLNPIRQQSYPASFHLIFLFLFWNSIFCLVYAVYYVLCVYTAEMCPFLLLSTFTARNRGANRSDSRLATTFRLKQQDLCFGILFDFVLRLLLPSHLAKKLHMSKANCVRKDFPTTRNCGYQYSYSKLLDSSIDCVIQRELIEY